MSAVLVAVPHEPAKPAKPDLAMAILERAVQTRYSVRSNAVFGDLKRRGYSPRHRPHSEGEGQQDVGQHLRGHLRFGVFLVNPGESTTKLAALDFDDHDGKLGWTRVLERVNKVAQEFLADGVKFCPVRSGGGKGIHLWLLFDSPQSAERVRDYLYHVLERAGIPTKSGKSGVDIFPKQDSVSGGGFGNLLALPNNGVDCFLNLVSGEVGVTPDYDQLPVLSAVPDAPARSKRVVMTATASGAGRPPAWDADKLKAALEFIDADCDYDSWFRVLMALARDGGKSDEAREIAREWSQSAPDRYSGDEDFDKLWNGLSIEPRAKQIHIGTIFKLAKDAGWNGKRAQVAGEGEESQGVVPGEDGEDEEDGGKFRVNCYKSLHNVIDQIDEVVAKLDPPEIFRFVDSVARVSMDKDITPVDSDRMYPRLVPTIKLYESSTADVLGAQLQQAGVRFRMKDTRKSPPTYYTSPMPPTKILSAWMGSERPTLPRLARIVFGPVMRSDGSILEELGYDPATGLYRAYAPGEAGDDNFWGNVSPATKPEELAECLRLLWEPFRDFRLTNKGGVNVPVLGVLTGVTRHLCGAAPAFCGNAPQQDSGKTLLIEAVLKCGLGLTQAASTAWPRDPEEVRKYLFSCALAGRPYAFFDNIRGDLDSPALEQYLTADGILNGRVLGVSSERTMPWRALIALTGNQMNMTTDLLRRSLIAEINTGETAPGTRAAESFAHPDLTGWVRDNWRLVYAAAIRLVRGYLECVSPEQRAAASGSGSFHEWVSWTQAPLNWAVGVVRGAKLGVAMVYPTGSDKFAREAQYAYGLTVWDAAIELSRAVAESGVVNVRAEVMALLQGRLLDMRKVTKHSQPGAPNVVTFTANTVAGWATDLQNKGDWTLYEFFSNSKGVVTPASVGQKLHTMVDINYNGLFLREIKGMDKDRGKPYQIGTRERDEFKPI